MKEEFHGIRNTEDTATIEWKKTYVWNTLTANVWLPSLSELVGTTGVEHATTGCYNSAMQGINISPYYWTDAKGGTQFAYFQQHNTAGGGEAIWNTCNREMTWLRSPDLDIATDAWHTASSAGLSAPLVTYSRAVHPAVLT